MRMYLALTGTLFGAFAAFHVWATIAAIDRISSEPDLVAGRAAIAIVTGALAVWAWRLFQSSRGGARS